MRLGLCCSSKDAGAAKEAGFDYFEPPFRDVTAMSDAEFDAFYGETRALDFYPEAMNIMLPASARVTGDAADHAAIRPFLEKGFARAARVGTKAVVFGSSAARNLPDGFTDRERGYAQIIEFSRMAGDIAGACGCTVVIEPLPFRTANIVNFVCEGLHLTQRIRHPNVRVMADYTHMVSNHESVSVMYTLGTYLGHCHVPPPDSLPHYLSAGPYEWDYKPFFDALFSTGYGGGVSIEGRLNGPVRDAGRDALAALHKFRGG